VLGELEKGDFSNLKKEFFLIPEKSSKYLPTGEGH